MNNEDQPREDWNLQVRNDRYDKHQERYNH